MTIEYTIVDFPTIPIRSQLFHVPGAANEGGFTSGGVRMSSPSPGGRSVLEIQPSLSVREWEYPEASWLMSQIDGTIFRVRLVPTPQIATARLGGVVTWEPDTLWDNDKPWTGDLSLTFADTALEGTTTVKVAFASVGEILKRGHVLGHGQNSYIVDRVEYNEAGSATITIKPPLRKNVAVGDTVFFRPFFLGTISNGAEIRATYDAENVGLIQLNKFVFDEAIIQ